MKFRDEILHRRELDEMGWAYLAEYLNCSLVLSGQLAKVITNKHGRLISWLPDDVKIPKSSYFEAGLISSRPSRALSAWGGTEDVHALLLKNILTVQKHGCALFEDALTSYHEYKSTWSSDCDYFALPSGYKGEMYERWMPDAEIDALAESISGTSAGWHYLCAVGDNAGFPEFEGGALHTINAETLKVFAESVVFIAIEA